MVEQLEDGRVVLSKEEAEAFVESVQKDNYPKPEEKFGIFQFLNKVLLAKDSSKVSNLDKEELPAVRRLKQGAAYFEVINSNLIKGWLDKEAEIILSTSDSKSGFLIDAAITNKKDVKLGSKKPKEKTPWFKKNVQGGGGGGTE